MNFEDNDVLYELTRERLFELLDHCPHCDKIVRVLIKHKIEITIIAVEGKPKKIGPGHGLVVMIMVLYLPPLIHRLADNMDNIIDILI